MSCCLIAGCHRNRGWSDAYDKRAKRTREISIRVNDYELLELKKRIEEVQLQVG